MKLTDHLFGVAVVAANLLFGASAIIGAFAAGFAVFELCQDPYVAAVGGVAGFFAVVAVVSQCACWMSRAASNGSTVE